MSVGPPSSGFPEFDTLVKQSEKAQESKGLSWVTAKFWAKMSFWRQMWSGELNATKVEEVRSAAMRGDAYAQRVWDALSTVNAFAYKQFEPYAPGTPPKSTEPSQAALEVAPEATQKTSTSKEQAYGEVVRYVQGIYPEFPIANYPTIEAFQAAGQPLHFAVQKNNFHLFKLLAKAGADLRQKDEDGHNAVVALTLQTLFPTIDIKENSKNSQRGVVDWATALKDRLKMLDWILEQDPGLFVENYKGRPFLESLFGLTVTDPGMQKKNVFHHRLARKGGSSLCDRRKYRRFCRFVVGGFPKIFGQRARGF